VPECIAARNDPWEIPLVICDEADGVAVLTIRRPAVLNALNKEVFEQLGARVQEAEADESIEGIVITGFGRKAFVSGADIGMLAAVQSPADGEATSAHSHSYLNLIENCSKPVVCAYNGLAFGGGNELALACHKRIARTGLRVLAGQPEPNLGIIPGAGGTQRLPRVIGFEKAWTILRTGGVVSGRDAVDCGLISAEIDGDLRAEAIRLAKQMAADGFERINTDPITVPVDAPDVDLGHLSTAVDEIMRKAIVEGLARGLEEGLKFESKCFGEVCGLEDMRIGMENFMKNGPRVKAEFKHQ
jgi:enoyl-CoA hydratase/carnithine racemase